MSSWHLGASHSCWRRVNNLKLGINCGTSTLSYRLFTRLDSIPRYSYSTSPSSARDTKPLSGLLVDSFQRQHNYLRISVTERCNLRCLYCMPEEGIDLSPPSHLLTSSEIFYLSALFVSQGVTKIRLTGGEPTVRKDIVPLIRKIGTLRSRGLKELAITTNGITLSRKLDDFVSSGLTGVNISLDTLDSLKFQIMTRRQGLESVLKTINRVLDLKRTGTLLNLKVNCVVMRGLNDKEIVHFVEYTRSRDVEVRFIEYMPFGGNKWSEQKMVPFREMLETIQSKYPDIHRLQGYANDTSRTYQIPGFAGRVGFITSMTNHFCNTCNRLRITGDGNLKVCLHGNAEVSLRDVLRQGNHGEPITETRFQELRLKEQLRASQEFTPDSNNGWLEHEERLLQVIGDAVKRKKAQHAGMGQLEKATNRPMILIGNDFSFLLGQHRSRPRFNVSYFTNHIPRAQGQRLYSTSAKPQAEAILPHLTPASTAHMIDVSPKPSTARRAIAVGRVRFSSPTTAALIAQAAIKKGDVLGVARIAGIMATKQTPQLVPLCHPIALTGVRVTLQLVQARSGETRTQLPPSSDLQAVSETCDTSRAGHMEEEALQPHGGVAVQCEVLCVGPTGVEMEALSGVMGALLSVVDMVKAVDKKVVMEEIKVILKEGGRSGTWTHS